MWTELGHMEEGKKKDVAEAKAVKEVRAKFCKTLNTRQNRQNVKKKNQRKVVNVESYAKKDERIKQCW